MSHRHSRLLLLSPFVGLFCCLAQSASADLLGHWKLDDALGSPTAIDSSPQGHDASVGGGVTLGQPGISNTAAEFSGSSVGIDANMGGDWVTGDGARTVSAWLRPDTFSGGQRGIFGNGSNTGNFTRFDFNTEVVSGNNSIMFRYQGGNIAWSGTAELGQELQTDTWYHLAVTVPDNATFGDVDVYIDGQLLAADGGNMNSLATALATGGNFRIGETGGDFDGLLDDVQYYNMQLTPEEIGSLFQNPGLSLDEIGAIAVPEPSSIAIWTLIGLGLAGFGYTRTRQKN